MEINRGYVERMIEQLNPDVAELYRRAEVVLKSTEDSLTDSYQIAAQVHDVFWNYAKSRAAMEIGHFQ